jgi:peptidyl-prolyl cis-trans isomerase C
MKRFLTLTAATLSLAAAVHAQSAPAPASAATPKTIVATVNGETITIDDLNRLYETLPPTVRENYEASGGRTQFLEQYLRRKLLVQEAIKNNFDKSPRTAAMLRDAHESTMFDLYVRQVIAEDIVSEADVRKYYDTNIEQYRFPERVKARHIIATPVAEPFVPNTSRDNAKSDEEALRKMESLDKIYHINGGNFAELAIRFSEDASAQSGGDLGWFEKGRMVPEFEQAAFATPKGKLSGIVKTQFGYHRIFVEDHRPAGTKPFEAVRHDIRERLLTERAERVMSEVNALTMDLQANSKIQVFKENIPE